jgi:hypothetical protein
MGEVQIQYIAVVDFKDLNGRTSELGIFISEELLACLHDSQRVKVVERRLLGKVLEEHQLGLTALLDENSVKKLGKILGVDAICTIDVGTYFLDRIYRIVRIFFAFSW